MHLKYLWVWCWCSLIIAFSVHSSHGFFDLPFLFHYGGAHFIAGLGSPFFGNFLIWPNQSYFPNAVPLIVISSLLIRCISDVLHDVLSASTSTDVSFLINTRHSARCHIYYYHISMSHRTRQSRYATTLHLYLIIQFLHLWLLRLLLLFPLLLYYESLSFAILY